ncbi:MAG: HEAT repeat domain-containing protein [Acidobacteriota bacterium]
MLFLVLFVVVIIAVIWWLNGERALSRNERLYLKRRGYEPPSEVEDARPVSKDTRLFSLIESLSDISPFARQRAAEDLSRMCVSGQGDTRMLPSLIVALDDSDASVRRAVATALTHLSDPSSVDALKRRMDVEESIQVRVALEQALARLGG